MRRGSREEAYVRQESIPARVRVDGGRERANRFDLTFHREVKALKVAAGGPELA